MTFCQNSNKLFNIKSIDHNIKNQAKKLKEVLFRSGMSARQFSEKLGISESQMSNIFRGKRCPSLDVLGRLAEYFQVDLNWLLGNETVAPKPDLPFFRQAYKVSP